jgi:hypothetical protein
MKNGDKPKDLIALATESHDWLKTPNSKTARAASKRPTDEPGASVLMVLGEFVAAVEDTSSRVCRSSLAIE